jgi:hypothetical protein
VPYNVGTTRAATARAAMSKSNVGVKLPVAAVGSDLSGCSRLVLEAVAVEPAVISREFRLPASAR